jgi:hypothetical protein
MLSAVYAECHVFDIHILIVINLSVVIFLRHKNMATLWATLFKHFFTFSLKLALSKYGLLLAV